jgi:hypothetical protein
MRPLSDADIVRVWEYGYAASPIRRALALITAATDRNPRDETQFLSLTPGERDAKLFSVRRHTFGSALECIVACPSCGESLEFRTEIAALVPDVENEYIPDRQPITLTDAGYSVTVRPPTIGDLEEQASLGEESIIERCVLHADHDGQPIAPDEIPAPLVAAIDAHLSVADPAAIAELNIVCPACAHSWAQIFDIAAFLWAEIAARAARIVREVHVLAREYGWSESEILALSAPRRMRYLELVRE